MAVIAERLGAPSPPRSVADLRARLKAFRPELQVGSQARAAVRFLVVPPLPVAARPAMGAVLSAGSWVLGASPARAAAEARVAGSRTVTR